MIKANLICFGEGERKSGNGRFEQEKGIRKKFSSAENKMKC
jgi:hypothetical protein